MCYFVFLCVFYSVVLYIVVPHPPAVNNNKSPWDDCPVPRPICEDPPVSIRCVAGYRSRSLRLSSP
jgi:hypothetical protein